VATFVESTFSCSCWARRDDPDDFACLSIAVTNQKQLGLTTHTEHQKPIFCFRVFLIEKLNRELVIEDSLSLLERNAVFPEILGCLA